MSNFWGYLFHSICEGMWFEVNLAKDPFFWLGGGEQFSFGAVFQIISNWHFQIIIEMLYQLPVSISLTTTANQNMP